MEIHTVPAPSHLHLLLFRATRTLRLSPWPWGKRLSQRTSPSPLACAGGDTGRRGPLLTGLSFTRQQGTTITHVSSGKHGLRAEHRFGAHCWADASMDWTDSLHPWWAGARPSQRACTDCCVSSAARQRDRDSAAGLHSARFSGSSRCHQGRPASTHRGMQQSLGFLLLHGASLQREALYLPSLGKE